MSEELVERVGFAIAASLWTKPQAATFFKLRERNVHFTLACNAARAAMAEMLATPNNDLPTGNDGAKQ